MFSAPFPFGAAQSLLRRNPDAVAADLRIDARMEAHQYSASGSYLVTACHHVSDPVGQRFGAQQLSCCHHNSGRQVTVSHQIGLLMDCPLLPVS